MGYGYFLEQNNTSQRTDTCLSQVAISFKDWICEKMMVWNQKITKVLGLLLRILGLTRYFVLGSSCDVGNPILHPWCYHTPLQMSLAKQLSIYCFKVNHYKLYISVKLKEIMHYLVKKLYHSRYRYHYLVVRKQWPRNPKPLILFPVNLSGIKFGCINKPTVFWQSQGINPQNHSWFTLLYCCSVKFGYQKVADTCNVKRHSRKSIAKNKKRNPYHSLFLQDVLAVLAICQIRVHYKFI